MGSPLNPTHGYPGSSSNWRPASAGTLGETRRGSWLVECCFTSTETVGLLGTGAQDGHLDFHTAPELWHGASFDTSDVRAIKPSRNQKRERTERKVWRSWPGTRTRLHLFFRGVRQLSGGTAAGISPLNAALDIKMSRWRFLLSAGGVGGGGGGGGSSFF